MKSKFIDYLGENPIISAVSDIAKLDSALKSPSKIIFLLSLNICNLDNISKKIKESNKMFFIHFDMIEGLDNSPKAVEFIINKMDIDGLLTTKSNIVKYAKNQGVLVIQRFFIIDSKSLESSISMIRKNKPNAIEIMPGIMPKIVKKIKKEINIPVITGGLINEKEDIINSLKSGAEGVSTSKTDLWSI